MRNNKPLFENWDDDIHLQPDQIKRAASAKKKDTTPASVDTETRSAVFPGSGKNPYVTTMHDCTCGDFFRRHLPCKHMYRLAMELGEMQGSFTSGLNKNLSLSLQEAVAIIENYSEDQQQFVKKILPQIISGKEPVAEYISEDMQIVLSCPLFVFTPCSMQEVLNDYRKVDIEEMLSEKNKLPVKKLLKADLIAYCCKEVPELRQQLSAKYVIGPAEQFRKCMRRTYTYLCRKYDWTYEYNDKMERIVIPYGSISAEEILGNNLHGLAGLYCFPNDEITALLSFYGHNRCENGFLPQEK